ncbi:hypothetical protein AK812_SmicGene19630 [Symbiodinium microadriaticum]|uniref:Uncharacterized protein n=1 Tax=Symbiodinium microadriaticum TaxID=2951 RepID=A0A1Q9DS24_SYMMI|nr:hypothetical protein AK812_SmicGene19630 [Symbiodinium microadriaticum]
MNSLKARKDGQLLDEGRSDPEGAAGTVDYRYVWGGQLKSKEEMYIFEALSVSLNLLMLLLVLTRGGWLNACPCLPASFQRALCALFCGLFACNTVGNALAKTNFERCVFLPLTLLSAVAFARLALD